MAGIEILVTRDFRFMIIGLVVFASGLFFGGCGFTAVIGMPGRHGKRAPIFAAQGFRTEARGTRRKKSPPRSRGKHKRERAKKEVLSWLGEYRCQPHNICCHTFSLSTIFSRAADAECRGRGVLVNNAISVSLKAFSLAGLFVLGCSLGGKNPRLFAIGSGEMFRKRHGMSFTQRTQRSQSGTALWVPHSR